MGYLVDVKMAFPEHYYSQEEIITAMKEQWEPGSRNEARLGDFHRNVQVAGRYLSLPLPRYFELDSLKDKNEVWLETALEVLTAAATEVLQENDMKPSDISLIVSTSSTGIAVPSLEARLMNKLPFREDTKRMPLFGLGCLGGAAGLNRAFEYLKAHPKEAALFLSVELCSLTLQLKDSSVANLISTGLFSDGGGAVVLVGEEHPMREKAKLKWMGGFSRFFPDTERYMGWDVVSEGFKIILSGGIPEIALNKLPLMLDDFLKMYELKREDLSFFLAHPGGPKVLEAMEEAFQLRKNELAQSWDSLNEVGNMSSASVLLVTKETLKKKLSKGSLGLMAAMGPAFCAEMALYKAV